MHCGMFNWKIIDGKYYEHEATGETRGEARCIASIMRMRTGRSVRIFYESKVYSRFYDKWMIFVEEDMPKNLRTEKKQALKR
jgi:hypothetical protein